MHCFKLLRRFTGVRSIASYTAAVTRKIDVSLVRDALRSNSDITIDLAKAISQHHHLENVLKECGVKVSTLESDGFPDSVFIEDTAVVIDKTAFITLPGAPSRRGETKRVADYFKHVYGATYQLVHQSNGTLDGGDVLFTGMSFYLFFVRNIIVSYVVLR